MVLNSFTLERTIDYMNENLTVSLPLAASWSQHCGLIQGGAYEEI